MINVLLLSISVFVNARRHSKKQEKEQPSMHPEVFCPQTHSAHHKYNIIHIYPLHFFSHTKFCTVLFFNCYVFTNSVVALPKWLMPSHTEGSLWHSGANCSSHLWPSCIDRSLNLKCTHHECSKKKLEVSKVSFFQFAYRVINFLVLFTSVARMPNLTK